MTTEDFVGSVASLWRFPVKSMTGERLDHAELTERGLLGDRAYALIDVNSGKVASAKSVRHFPGLLNLRAAFVEPPRLGSPMPPVRITLPDNKLVISDSADVDSVLSAYFGREVKLARSAPDDFTIDQYHPDVSDLDPEGPRDTVVEQKLGSAFFAEAGLASPVPAGAFFDLFPVSVLTKSTLARLSALQPQSRIDERRFRMNVIIEAREAGFPENSWVGHTLAIGDSAKLNIAVPDPRCVMTTLAQDDLDGDSEVLRTLIRHNKIQVGDAGQYPCAGVYAVVGAAGTLKIGDSVSVN